MRSFVVTVPGPQTLKQSDYSDFAPFRGSPELRWRFCSCVNVLKRLLEAFSSIYLSLDRLKQRRAVGASTTDPWRLRLFHMFQKKFKTISTTQRLPQSEAQISQQHPSGWLQYCSSKPSGAADLAKSVVQEPSAWRLALPLLSLEVQQPPSAPPHFSLRADTSLSRRSRRSRRAAKSISQPQEPEPESEPDGTSLILWVRTSGEPGLRSISLPGKHRGTG